MIADSQIPFSRRHIGPSAEELSLMLDQLGLASLDQLAEEALPASIRLKTKLTLPVPCSESEALDRQAELAGANRRTRCFIGQGFHPCVTPAVIKRCILENPSWYTQYTPYQAEISQGRLQALLNFQTLVADLTGLPVATASLLDEASAAAEAMQVCYRARPRSSSASAFLVSDRCHPQILAVVRTRARFLGIEARVEPLAEFRIGADVFGALVQCPDTDGSISDFSGLCEELHHAGALAVVATDPLACAVFAPPGEMGADIAVGTTQRLGMGMGMGGPHAAFLSAKDELKRILPGRIVGVARDEKGRSALRLALQTREQHIRRERATSNICTAQVLPAIVASMYAVYHGPEGLKAIAASIAARTEWLRSALEGAGCEVLQGPVFDTVKLLTSPVGALADIWRTAQGQGVSLRSFGESGLGISLSETTSVQDLKDLVSLLAGIQVDLPEESPAGEKALGPSRRSPLLAHPVFSSHRTETQLLRYITELQTQDLSLANSMIPLGSCTMKLNAAAELEPVTWPGYSDVHPYEHPDNLRGYDNLFQELRAWLAEITGLPAVSLQPNAGSQGEYAGLLTIKSFFESRGESQRVACLIPSSAHGTNPATAQMAGMEVVVVTCDSDGNIDLRDLESKIEVWGDRLAACMITYPSTHGVFEERILEVTEAVHEAGAKVYVDGANMNAMVGLSSPARIGGDVCHLNLHKTFCIPHGGGGPGMGPICVTEELSPFLPTDPNGPGVDEGGYSVAATANGSGAILPISHSYIAMMGSAGLKEATGVAILNANYMASRLESYFPVLYRGNNGRVAHECIVDLSWLRPLGLSVDDVAKRLMDYGFHAPTVSWPVPFTMMIEPTESESKAELDRFCDAMISIWNEIEQFKASETPVEASLLRLAPFPYADVLDVEWHHSFSREEAALPAPWLRSSKYWPPVSRIDNVWGDRNFACVCPPMEVYATE